MSAYGNNKKFQTTLRNDQEYHRMSSLPWVTPPNAGFGSIGQHNNIQMRSRHITYHPQGHYRYQPKSGPSFFTITQNDL